MPIPWTADDIARLDLERMQNLFDEGAVSGQSLEQARLAYENAKAQYDQAASVVDLVSPIEGVVTERPFKIRQAFEQISKARQHGKAAKNIEKHEDRFEILESTE